MHTISLLFLCGLVRLELALCFLPTLFPTLLEEYSIYPNFVVMRQQQLIARHYMISLWEYLNSVRFHGLPSMHGKIIRMLCWKRVFKSLFYYYLKCLYALKISLIIYGLNFFRVWFWYILRTFILLSIGTNTW